jgi:hypothetical protein
MSQPVMVMPSSHDETLDAGCRLQTSRARVQLPDMVDETHRITLGEDDRTVEVARRTSEGITGTASCSLAQIPLSGSPTEASITPR